MSVFTLMPQHAALKPSLMGARDKSTPMSTLYHHDLGEVEYLAALALQEKMAELRRREFRADTLLFVEHPHVYTLGRGGKAINVIDALQVPVYRTSRGGDVTYHGPGQLVVYPIIDLRSKLRKDVHRYLGNLERAAIETLQDFGLEGTRRPPYTGIWVGNRKIAAIGVAVRRAITLHGLALNVNTDLSYFDRIIPCGLDWADVTSMSKELGAKQEIKQVQKVFLLRFAEVFAYSNTKEIVDLFDLQAGQKGSSYEAHLKG
jgi:lipoyl(octanoyl) transferase